MNYYKTGTRLTVETASNGYLVATEKGRFVVESLEKLVALILSTTTNQAEVDRLQGQDDKEDNS
ncbi:hypothetical protein [Kineobactrum salinum]|uniref:Uncharacterized protein n=1 Tax=Kineobactrum salinum TaxID=2708301 RepID=A0A6C0U4X6_9GAMM|nr:hypothetical protein [Kineobactrum salinum]QIB67161.1 hypothetical protein G3T16_18890 [Kineobactrum salinum]